MAIDIGSQKINTIYLGTSKVANIWIDNKRIYQPIDIRTDLVFPTLTWQSEAPSSDYPVHHSDASIGPFFSHKYIMYIKPETWEGVVGSSTPRISYIYLVKIDKNNLNNIEYHLLKLADYYFREYGSIICNEETGDIYTCCLGTRGFTANWSTVPISVTPVVDVFKLSSNNVVSVVNTINFATHSIYNASLASYGLKSQVYAAHTSFHIYFALDTTPYGTETIVQDTFQSNGLWLNDYGATIYGQTEDTQEWYNRQTGAYSFPNRMVALYHWRDTLVGLPNTCTSYTSDTKVSIDHIENNTYYYSDITDNTPRQQSKAKYWGSTIQLIQLEPTDPITGLIKFYYNNAESYPGYPYEINPSAQYNITVPTQSGTITSYAFCSDSSTSGVLITREDSTNYVYYVYKLNSTPKLILCDTFEDSNSGSFVNYNTYKTNKYYFLDYHI